MCFKEAEGFQAKGNLSFIHVFGTRAAYGPGSKLKVAKDCPDANVILK